MSIVERIKYAASMKNLTISSIEKAIGLTPKSIYRWDKSEPSISKVVSVANLLQVPLSWLATGSDPVPSIYEDFLSRYENLSDIDKKKIDSFIEIASINSKNIYVSENNTLPEKINETVTPYTTHSHIAVLGHVAAGKPIEGISIPLDYISAPVSADYALIAQGHSMEPVIQDGDYIYVKNCEELHTGDIGIFYIDGEVTCKKFYPQPDCILLKSLNPDFKPFKYPLNEWHDFKIQGKVLLSNEQRSRGL